MAATIDGNLNFRDLGGVPVRDGELRHRLLFRSAAPVKLMELQHISYASLGLATVVDMRYDSERASKPVDWQALGVSRCRIQQNEPAGGADFAKLLLDDAFEQQDAIELMKGVYRRLPFDHIPSLRDVFAALLEDERPVLIHCTSGKDRTGMAVALLLTALGSPPASIMEEYLRSLSYDAFSGPTYSAIPKHRHDALRPIFSVRREYLDAMFDEIAEKSGSVDGFLRDALSIGPKDIELLGQVLTRLP